MTSRRGLGRDSSRESVEFIDTTSIFEEDGPKVSGHHSYPMRNGQVEWEKGPQ